MVRNTVRYITHLVFVVGTVDSQAYSCIWSFQLCSHRCKSADPTFLGSVRQVLTRVMVFSKKQLQRAVLVSFLQGFKNKSGQWAELDSSEHLTWTWSKLLQKWRAALLQRFFARSDGAWINYHTYLWLQMKMGISISKRQGESSSCKKVIICNYSWQRLINCLDMFQLLP